MQWEIDQRTGDCLLLHKDVQFLFFLLLDFALYRAAVCSIDPKIDISWFKYMWMLIVDMKLLKMFSELQKCGIRAKASGGTM